MNRSQVIAKLKAVEPDLRAHGIAGLFLFGSFSRDDANPDSDVDLFVDKASDRPFGFDELMSSYRTVSSALPNLEVSFGTREGLSKYVRDEIERDAIRIF